MGAAHALGSDGLPGRRRAAIAEARLASERPVANAGIGEPGAQDGLVLGRGGGEVDAGFEDAPADLAVTGSRLRDGLGSTTVGAALATDNNAVATPAFPLALRTTTVTRRVRSSP